VSSFWGVTTTVTDTITSQDDQRPELEEPVSQDRTGSLSSPFCCSCRPFRSGCKSANSWCEPTAGTRPRGDEVPNRRRRYRRIPEGDQWIYDSARCIQTQAVIDTYLVLTSCGVIWEGRDLAGMPQIRSEMPQLPQIDVCGCRSAAGKART
jgi:hypothetical protein